VPVTAHVPVAAHEMIVPCITWVPGTVVRGFSSR
jgi:hypothetical protein